LIPAGPFCWREIGKSEEKRAQSFCSRAEKEPASALCGVGKEQIIISHGSLEPDRKSKPQIQT